MFWNRMRKRMGNRSKPNYNFSLDYEFHINNFDNDMLEKPVPTKTPVPPSLNKENINHLTDDLNNQFTQNKQNLSSKKANTLKTFSFYEHQEPSCTNNNLDFIEHLESSQSFSRADVNTVDFVSTSSTYSSTSPINNKNSSEKSNASLSSINILDSPENISHLDTIKNNEPNPSNNEMHVLDSMKISEHSTHSRLNHNLKLDDFSSNLPLERGIIPDKRQSLPPFSNNKKHGINILNENFNLKENSPSFSNSKTPILTEILAENQNISAIDSKIKGMSKRDSSDSGFDSSSSPNPNIDSILSNSDHPLLVENTRSSFNSNPTENLHQKCQSNYNDNNGTKHFVLLSGDQTKIIDHTTDKNVNVNSENHFNSSSLKDIYAQIPKTNSKASCDDLRDNSQLNNQQESELFLLAKSQTATCPVQQSCVETFGADSEHEYSPPPIPLRNYPSSPEKLSNDSILTPNLNLSIKKSNVLPQETIPKDPISPKLNFKNNLKIENKKEKSHVNYKIRSTKANSLDSVLQESSTIDDVLVTSPPFSNSSCLTSQFSNRTTINPNKFNSDLSPKVNPMSTSLIVPKSAELDSFHVDSMDFNKLMSCSLMETDLHCSLNESVVEPIHMSMDEVRKEARHQGIQLMAETKHSNTCNAHLTVSTKLTQPSNGKNHIYKNTVVGSVKEKGNKFQKNQVHSSPTKAPNHTHSNSNLSLFNTFSHKSSKGSKSNIIDSQTQPYNNKQDKQISTMQSFSSVFRSRISNLFNRRKFYSGYSSDRNNIDFMTHVKRQQPRSEIISSLKKPSGLSKQETSRSQPLRRRNECISPDHSKSNNHRANVKSCEVQRLQASGQKALDYQSGSPSVICSKTPRNFDASSSTLKSVSPQCSSPTVPSFLKLDEIEPFPIQLISPKNSKKTEISSNSAKDVDPCVNSELGALEDSSKVKVQKWVAQQPNLNKDFNVTDILNNGNHIERLNSTSENADFIASLVKLKDCGWYWGPLGWDEAEERLRGKPDGSFLVRDSSDERYILSLSFRSQNGTHHTRIEHYKGTFSFYSQPQSHGASTIVEFIQKAMEHSHSGKFLYFLRPREPGLAPAPVLLLYPVSRFNSMQSLQHICRFTILKRVRYDHIELLPLPLRLRTYLKDTQYYAEFCGSRRSTEVTTISSSNQTDTLQFFSLDQ